LLILIFNLSEFSVFPCLCGVHFFTEGAKINKLFFKKI
jgi:hypothetical protein